MWANSKSVNGASPTTRSVALSGHTAVSSVSPWCICEPTVDTSGE